MKQIQFRLNDIVYLSDDVLIKAGRRLKWRGWVAEITGTDPRYGLARDFLDPYMDYAQAEKSSRRITNIAKWYWLDEGKYYQMRYRKNKWDYRQYFCKVKNGKLFKVEREEVKKWAASI